MEEYEDDEDLDDLDLQDDLTETLAEILEDYEEYTHAACCVAGPKGTSCSIVLAPTDFSKSMAAPVVAYGLLKLCSGIMVTVWQNGYDTLVQMIEHGDKDPSAGKAALIRMISGAVTGLSEQAEALIKNLAEEGKAMMVKVEKLEAKENNEDKESSSSEFFDFGQN